MHFFLYLTTKIYISTHKLDHNLTEGVANFAHTIVCVYYSAIAEVCSLWIYYFFKWKGKIHFFSTGELRCIA